MAKNDQNDAHDMNAEEQTYRHKFQMRLPVFVSDPHKDVGLGDVIKRATSLVGVKPCGGCKDRAAALNRRVRFVSARHRGR